MSLWKIAWRSIQQRALASGLTGLSMAMGVALVAAVLVIHGVVERSFRRGAQGYDLIVGPKGSPLQLVLNTVYHLSEPVGKIPESQYNALLGRRFELPDGRLTPPFRMAIPLCMGGNFRGYRVVGTRPEFFELEYHEGEHYEFTRNGGQGQNMAIDGYFEAVIGSTVARNAGLKVGDTFRPRHGLDPAIGEEHDPCTVVGIFAPTGTPNDRAIFMNIEGFFRMHEHHAGEKEEEEGEPTAKPPAEKKPAAKSDHAEHDHAGHDHAHERQVSALLVCLDDSDQSLAMAMPTLIANGFPQLQAVHPAAEISKLLDGIVGNVQWVLLILAILVVVVAGIGILVSIYNSMNDRRHEIAVMRALGASRLTVMLVILLESILLSLGGGAVGLVLAHGLIGLLGPMIAEQTGVSVGALQFQVSELILIPGLVILASVVGYLPAVSAYRTDVAKSLAATQ
jgi:putative ABC transport system permease protein